MCVDYDLQKPLRMPQLEWGKSRLRYYRTKKINGSKEVPELFNFYLSDCEGDKVLSQHIMARLNWDTLLQNQETYDAIEECLHMTRVSSEVNKTNWSIYYLNLQKIINVCWDAGSIVGCGRGSGVGFILLYILELLK